MFRIVVFFFIYFNCLNALYNSNGSFCLDNKNLIKKKFFIFLNLLFGLVLIFSMENFVFLELYIVPYNFD